MLKSVRDHKHHTNPGKHHARITRLWCGILELSAPSSMTLGKIFNLCATFCFFIFKMNFYFMSGEEVINIKTSDVDGYSQKMYSSCYCCIIKVSGINISGLFLPPPPDLKLRKKIKEKTLSSLSSWFPLSLFIVQNLYNPVISLFLRSPLLASPTVLCLLWALVQASQAGPVSGHGLMDLLKIRENGSTFFPEVGAEDPFKLLSELPGPLAPYPLRMGKRKTYLY